MRDSELYATILGVTAPWTVGRRPGTTDALAQTVSMHDIIRAAETTSAASGCATTARLPA
jgi:hypothetical protein